MKVKKQRTLTIRHTRQRARHVLQTALPLLCRDVHLANIIYMEQPARHGDDQGVIDVVDRVYPFRRLV